MKSLALIVAFIALLVASADAREVTRATGVASKPRQVQTRGACLAQIGRPAQTRDGLPCTRR